MKYFTNKWERKVRDYCDSQYELIIPVAGDINFYYKCHLIATHHAIKNDDEKIALVVYRDKDNLLPCVHFINYDGKNYIDNTIGHWVEKHEYRFVRWIGKDEFFKTPQILTDTKTFFINMGSFMGKTFGDIHN